MSTEIEAPEEKRIRRLPRKLTRFVAEELLYEYVQGTLDPERKSALESQLAEDAQTRETLKMILRAENYVKTLSTTKISNIHLAELQTVRPWRQAFLEKLKWQSWPDLMKWTTEALGVSIVIALIAVLIPWHEFDFQLQPKSADVTLAEIESGGSELEVEAASPATSLKKDETTSAVSEKVDKSEQAKAGESNDSTPPATAAAKSAPESVASEATPTKEATAKAAQPEATPARTEKVLKGELYNMMMNITVTEEVAESIRTRITRDGGAKAGQVELGWVRKNPDGRYYHFSLPKEKYQQFVEFLNSFGRVRIYKNAHERIMPEDQMRIILWVEDTSSKASEPTSSSEAGTAEPMESMESTEPATTSKEEP